MSTVKNTLVIIGPERTRVRGLITARSWGEAVEEHKGKLVVSFETKGDRVEVVKEFIRLFPYLKFVYFYECEDPAYRGTVKGKDGKVTGENFKEGRKVF